MSWVDRCGESIGERLERRPGMWLAFCGALYLIATLGVARRAFWYDELFTWYMSRLPSMPDVWAALLDGADLNPPLFYLATRAGQAVFGTGPIATRLPAIAGFLVMCLCLYRFVARRAGPVAGFVAMLAPFLTGAYYYAAEARAYGMELGFAGAALLSWQAAMEPNRRWWSLPLFTTALAGALLTHCYALLLLIPFGLAEAARTWQRRRIDGPFWACFAVLAPVGLIYAPLFAAMSRFKLTNPIFQPGLLFVPQFYLFLLHFGIWPVLGASWLGRRRTTRSDEPNAGIPLHEWICASGFLLTPLFAYMLAANGTGVLMIRYGVAAVIGVSLLLGLYVARQKRRARGGAIIALFAVSAVLIAANTISTAHRETRQPIDLSRAPAGLPIVVSSGLLFLEAGYYQPASLSGRLHFLTDEDASMRYTGSNVFDVGYPTMAKWFPLRGTIEPYSSFRRRNSHFLVYGTPSHPLDWMVRRLKAEGAQMRELQSGTISAGRVSLLDVTWPDGQSPIAKLQTAESGGGRGGDSPR